MAEPQKNTYRGKVKISYKKGNSIIKKATHNRGLSDMALLFAKAITSNLNIYTDVPRLLDIGYIPTDQENTGVWQSILNNPVNIGGRQYNFDSALNNWVATLTSTVYYSDLNGGILDEVLNNADMGLCSLRIRLCSYELKNRKYFAEIDITSEDIRLIKESTSAIITWYSELLYDNESELDTGNIN